MSCDGSSGIIDTARAYQCPVYSELGHVDSDVYYIFGARYSNFLSFSNRVRDASLMDAIKWMRARCKIRTQRAFEERT